MRRWIRMNEVYTKALTEVDEVLNYLDVKLLNKIPETFKNFIKNSKNKMYKYQYNKEKPLYEQELSKEAKAIISLIYRDYICYPQEKNQLVQEEKINMQNEFKVKEIETIKNDVKTETKAIAIIEKESFWKKVINKMKKILRGEK